MRRFAILLVIAVILAVVNACNAIEQGTFDRVLIVMFENMGYLKTLKQQYFGGFLKRNSQLLSNYYGVTHPSQPNYVAIISGATGVQDDKDHDYPATVATVVDLLEQKGLKWKSYQENYPLTKNTQDSAWNDQGCFYGHTSADRLYWRKHNPFMSFTNVQNNSDRCARNVNSEQLFKDIQTAQQAGNVNLLPQLMFYTPNIQNCGHDTGVVFADRWYQKFLPQLLNNAFFMNGTLIVSTWDEDDGDSERNHIYTSLTGSMAPQGSTDGGKYDHYSLLRSIEDNFALGTLNRNDTAATSFQKLNKADKYKPWKPLP